MFGKAVPQEGSGGARQLLSAVNDLEESLLATVEKGSGAGELVFNVEKSRCCKIVKGALRRLFDPIL